MVGAQPSMEIIAKEDRTIVLNHAKGTREERLSDDPLSEPSAIASKWEPVKVNSLPDVFCGTSDPHQLSPFLFMHLGSTGYS